MKKIWILFLLIPLLIVAMGCTPRGKVNSNNANQGISNTNTVTREFEAVCVQGGGKVFVGDTCGDKCGTLGNVCGDWGTYDCDCGKGKCWNGSACVDGLSAQDAG